MSRPAGRFLVRSLDFGDGTLARMPNREPHKCAGLIWTNPDELPDNTVPYSAAAIAQIQAGAHFSTDGWTY